MPPPTEFEKYRVLVLDQSLTPMSLVSWQNGIRLVFRGSCKVLANYDGLSIRSATKTHAFPAVISYTTSHRPKFREIKFNRENVYLRDRGQCAYCLILLTRQTLTLDHVKPRKDGGKSNFENVVSCCYTCNQIKGGKSLKESGLTLHKPPTKPKSLPYRSKLLVDGVVPKEWSDYLW